jgi:hypothetical protein
VKRRKAPRRRAPKVHQPADRLGEDAVTLRKEAPSPVASEGVFCKPETTFADRRSRQ